MDIQKEKERMRQYYLDVRENIHPYEFEEKSKAIVERLTELTLFDEAHCIHCYVSMNDRKEVNTHGLLRQMLAAEKKVVVPVTDFDSGELEHVELNSFDDLKPNKWGVPEPTGGDSIAVDSFDLVIVPMVAGDKHGNRMGYGKGFYDRFLQKVSCPKIGLLFEACMANEIPVEPFDVKLDKLITENQIV